MEDSLLTQYEKVMILSIFVDGDDNLKSLYSTAADLHNSKLSTSVLNDQYIDAGFDLFNTSIEFLNDLNKVDFNICCAAKMKTSTNKEFNTGYYMYPRSSLSKSYLRLANSVGIIDAGYRGHLIGIFDKLKHSNEYKEILLYDRITQICAPGLVPIYVRIVNSKDELGETVRGDGGFGSTGR